MKDAVICDYNNRPLQYLGHGVLELKGKRDGKELHHYWRTAIYPAIVSEWTEALRLARYTDIEVRVINEREA